MHYFIPANQPIKINKRKSQDNEEPRHIEGKKLSKKQRQALDKREVYFKLG